MHLLAEDDAEVVVLGTKILARLLVVHGSAYVKKFTESSGGFVVMRYRLKRWWDIPTLYPIIFSILFNYDVAEIDFERSFDLFSLSELFGRKSLVYPDVLPIIVSMLQQGLNTLVHNQDDPDSPHPDKNNGPAGGQLKVPTLGSRRRSMSLTKELEARRKFISTPFLPDSPLIVIFRTSNIFHREAWWPGNCAPCSYQVLIVSPRTVSEFP